MIEPVADNDRRIHHRKKLALIIGVSIDHIFPVLAFSIERRTGNIETLPCLIRETERIEISVQAIGNCQRGRRIDFRIDKFLIDLEQCQVPARSA